MIGLAVLAWTMQTPDLLHAVVPRPTGQNGYEEYLQAAELAQGEAAKDFADWTPGQPFPGKSSDRPDLVAPLDVRREELRRFGRVLDLVARGNAKRVADPRASPGPETLFPELAPFRKVARLSVRAASVYAADGDTSRAVGALLDALTFADNAARGVLITNLVGGANAAAVLAGFVDLLPRLSRPDAVRVQQAVDALLARPVAIRSSMAAEAAFGVEAIRQAFAKNDLANVVGPEDERGPDSQGQRWQRELDALPPAGRQRLLALVRARAAERVRTMERIFAEPERTWADGFEAMDEASEGRPQDLVDALMAQTTPVFSVSVVVAVRIRSQIRLLGLHARLIQHRWDHGRYPQNLEAADPLTGEPYVYELREDGTVRLASKGIPQTGEIELKYARPAKNDREVAP